MKQAFGIADAAVRLLTPLVAAQLREWAVLVGAMAATAILFGVYPLMGAAKADCPFHASRTASSIAPDPRCGSTICTPRPTIAA